MRPEQIAALEAAALAATARRGAAMSIRCPMCTQVVALVALPKMLCIEHHYIGMATLLAKKIPPTRWTTRCPFGGAEVNEVRP